MHVSAFSWVCRSWPLSPFWRESNLVRRFCSANSGTAPHRPFLPDLAAAAEYVARTITARPEATTRPAPNARRARWVTDFDRPAIARRLVEIVEGQQFARS